MAAGDVEHFGRHRNAFGFLRLLFASLVIVSHATELFDGNRQREPLTRLFGTISFGELAVDGFFIISGYLVVASYLRRPAIGQYLMRRVARIYPGFIVASVVCLLIVTPLACGGSGQIETDKWGAFTRLLLLQDPTSAAFIGLPHPELNGSLWTIAYEFRCYLLVLALGAFGCFRRPWIIALFAAASLGSFELLPLSTFQHFDGLLPNSMTWFGRSDQTFRFAGIFLAGSLFYLLRARVRFTRRALLVSVPALVACLFFSKLAEPAIATFGAYVIFAAARWAGSTPIGRINDATDISYGVYLYAWPTTQLLVRYWPSMSPVVAELITFAVVILCGWASWRFVEQPMIAKAQQLARRKVDPNVGLEAVIHLEPISVPE